MTISASRSLLAGNLSHVGIRRYPLILSVAATSCINSIVVRLSGLKSRPPARSPVIILGFWRSGTTWLHDLLSADPRHVAPTTVQCLYPRSFPAAEYLAPIVYPFIPRKRPMDAMAVSPTSPQEDEFAILNAGLASPYRYFAFPSAMADKIDSTGCWPETESERMEWLDTWRRFVDQLAFRAGGRRLVLKSPAHTGRIGQILKAYPDAKFVHISRAPTSLLASNLNMFEAFTATQTFEARLPSQKARAEMVFRLFRRVYDSYFAEREMIPSGNLLEISYEHLIDDPAALASQIYGFLRAEGKVPEEVRLMIGARQNYQPEKHETLSEEDLARLRLECADYSEAFGYEV